VLLHDTFEPARNSKFQPFNPLWVHQSKAVHYKHWR